MITPAALRGAAWRMRRRQGPGDQARAEFLRLLARDLRHAADDPPRKRTRMDLQKLIDDLVAKNPKVQRFTGAIMYVKQGAAVPPGATHTLKLANEKGDELVVALTVKQPYATLLNLLLPVL